MPPDDGAAAPKKSRIRLIPIDWPAVRRHYSAGKLTVAEIGRRCQVDPSTIRCRAKRDGWIRRPAAQADAIGQEDRHDAVLALHRRDVTALLGLHAQLRAGLERVVAGRQDPNDARLLTKTGSLIDAFNALAASQARLIQLHRQAFGLQSAPKEDPYELAERIRAARQEMEAFTRGSPDVSLDTAPASSDAGGLPD